MPCTVILLRSNGALVLPIPEEMAQSVGVKAGSVVQLAIEGCGLSIRRARRSLADRLAVSPKLPSEWVSDEGSLRDERIGRELL